MLLRRSLAIMAAMAMIALNLPVLTYADSVGELDSTVLFFDDFDNGYKNNIITRHMSSDDYTNLTGNDFELSASIGIKENSNYFYSDKMETPGNADNTFKIKENSEIGSGRALDVTTQAGLNSCSWLIKNSGITYESISSKALVFTANFMVPSDNGLNGGNGVVVYLDEIEGNMPTTKWSFGIGMDWAYTNKLKSKTLLDIEAMRGQTTPCVFAFGEKLAEIEAGKIYKYKLILTPDLEGDYTARAEINNTVIELNDRNIPGVETISSNQFVMVAEKSNPYLIQNSYTGENGDKYKNDKTIALLDNLSMTAVSYVPENEVLFEEKFNNYSGEYIEKSNKNEISSYNNDQFTVRYDVSSSSWSDKDPTLIPKSEHPENIAKLVNGTFDAEAGKMLQLTSQGIITKGSMYRLSNISGENINGKALIFNAKFMIPTDGVYNKGVGFAAGLSPGNTEENAPDAVCISQNFQLNQNYLKNKYKLFAAQGMEFSVFGKVIDTLKAGELYSFTLKMVPDDDNHIYRVFAKLNDYEVEVFSEYIPTVDEMKTYKYAFIALHNHGWYTYSGSLSGGVSNYASDKPLVYLDDIKLERKLKSEVIIPNQFDPEEYQLFEDDFSDYGLESYIPQANTDTIEAYENNRFVLCRNAKSIGSDSNKFPGYVIKGNTERIARIAERSGFGNGKSLQLQSQGILSDGSMWKKSNITYEKIKNKTLVFKTEFMIPSSGEWNNGTVAAIAFSGKSNSSQSQPDAALGSSDFILKDINSKYMLAGVGSCDDYKRRLQVFGENISELEDDKNYSLTVTMTPSTEGRYSVKVNLNDSLKTLAGNGVPTCKDVGGYTYAAIISHSNRWNTSTAYSEDNPYLNDKDLICIDNISLSSEPIFYVSDNGDNSNSGSEAAPFKSIKRALSMVRNGVNTTIIAENDISIETMPELQIGGIAIRGKTSSTVVHLSEVFECRSDITFDNVTLTGSEVFANGYRLEVSDSVTSSERLTVYGGGNGKVINGDTDIRLYGGKYSRIYGGAYNAAVNGSTNVIFGGNCNTGDGIDDGKSDVSPCYVFGGGKGSEVSGKTNVTLLDDAVTKYIIGSGEGKSGTVGISTNININGGKVMNVYAGSSGAAPELKCDTNIIITNGVAEALFGGSEGTGLIGNTHLYLLGGEITRRVYSGCYNGTSGWLFISFNSSNHVNGTTNIVINDKVKLATEASSFNNAGVFAGSRMSSKSKEETNTIVFLKDSYENQKTFIGDKSGWSGTFKSFESYTVKSNGNGKTTFAGKGILNVNPDWGFAAQVGEKIYGNEDVNISEGVTEVNFLKNFVVDSIAKDKINKKITLNYTANNYFRNLVPKLYAAVYEKLSDGTIKLLNVSIGECIGENVLSIRLPDNISTSDVYVMKAMFMDKTLKPLTYIYETIY